LSSHFDSEPELIGSFPLLRPYQSSKPLNILVVVQVKRIQVYSKA